MPLTDSSLNLFLTAFLIITAMAYGWFTDKIDLKGALVGGVIAWLIFMGSSWAGLSLLFVFFFAGSFVSKWKYEKKEFLQLAQEDQGKRGAIHALSNGGFAALCGILSVYIHEKSSVFNLMLASSLAVACSDTFSSELGNVYGKRYINILTLKSEMRGLDGAISKEGTIWGLVGSLLIAITYGLSIKSFSLLVIVFFCGIVGNFFDSFLGATVQRQGMINNHAVNFFSTAFGGLVGGMLFFFFYH